jgi:hypothetical protein
MLPSLAVAYKQHQGVFRRNAKAAKMTGIMLLIIGAFLIFGAICNFGEMVSKGEWSSEFFLIFTCIFSLIGGYVLFCGIQQFRWAKELRIWQKTNVDASDKQEIKQETASLYSPPIQFSLRELLGFVAVVAAITSLTTWTIRSQPPRFIEHATPEQAGLSLPAGATDVCCRRGFRGTISYEFTIDEAGFLEWAKSDPGSYESQMAGIPLKPIEKPRFVSPLTKDGSGDREKTMIITNGYYYLWREEDRQVDYVYDKDRQRVHYSFQSY